MSTSRATGRKPHGLACCTCVDTCPATWWSSGALLAVVVVVAGYSSSPTGTEPSSFKRVILSYALCLLISRFWLPRASIPHRATGLFQAGFLSPLRGLLDSLHYFVPLFRGYKLSKSVISLWSVVLPNLPPDTASPVPTPKTPVVAAFFGRSLTYIKLRPAENLACPAEYSAPLPVLFNKAAVPYRETVVV